MEIGQPPAVQSAQPAMWITSRQYTGRIVTISNDKIFDEPVYNFTRDSPFIWEEINVPISYLSDRERAEEIMAEAAERHTAQFTQPARETWQAMERHYAVQGASVEPETYIRITDNALELTVRFIVPETGIREIKDAISRDILQGFKRSGIEIGVPTMIELVGTANQHGPERHFTAQAQAQSIQTAH